MGKRWLALVLAVGACAGPPAVDMTDVDPVVYQRDLDRCEAWSQGADAAGPIVAGGIMGATIGAGLGAIALGVPAITTTLAEGYGAAAGGAAGAGLGAATGKPLAAPPPAPGQTVAQCLAARGYKVTAPAMK